VLRTAGIGSVGPFFAITATPVVGSDPAGDPTDWAYCCGTASLGYTPFSTTGSLPTSFATGSSTNLFTPYTFNADDAQTISTLSVTVSGLTGTENCNDNATPLCSSIDPGAIGNCVKVSGHNYNCPVPAAQLNVTLLEGTTAVATGTINPDGTFTLVTPNGLPYSYTAGQTVTLKVMNPSGTVTDTITSGNWAL
jgi:hypothetical protein